jgi:hypothetical protein
VPETEIFNSLIGVQLTGIVEDTDGNLLAVTTHRVSDLGLGVITPISAWTTTIIGAPVSINNFNGSEELPEKNDIAIQTSILYPSLESETTSLYFDVNVPSSLTRSGLWLPSPWDPVSVPILVPSTNTEARQGTEIVIQPDRRDHIIPIADQELAGGATVEFILKLGSLYCARTTSPTDPRTVVPWSFKLKDTTQRGGASILNNVINPLLGETTTIVYTLTRPGPVTIQVFTLSGDIVDVLHRGQQTTGTHTVSWDGKNRGGRIVARGMYFIRIVGPGVNEHRKVLVVK